MLQRVLFLLLLPTLTLTAQPLVGPDAELWPLVEVKEPGDTAFQVRAGPARRSIQRGAPTLLRFTLAAKREDTLFLVFDRSFSEISLRNTDGEVLRNGNNLWQKDWVFSACNRVIPVPPTWEGPFILELQNHYFTRASRYDKPCSIRFYAQDFPRLFAEELDPQRSRPARTNQLIFFSVFGSILVLVFIAWVASRRAIFGAYLVYNGTVWLYYFVRKFGGLGYHWLQIPAYFRAVFEATASVLIMPAYLFFVRRFLRLGPSVLDRKIDRQITLMSRSSLIAAALVLLISKLFSVGWGYAFSVATNVVLLGWGIVLLYRIHQRKDHFSRVIIWAALALILGIGVIYSVLALRYFWPAIPEPDFRGLSYFQIGVLIEVVILLYGIAVWAGRRADGLGAAAGTGEVEEAVPTTLLINGYVLPLKDLLYLRGNGDTFLAHYREGAPKSFNGRLTGWYAKDLPQLPHFARIQRSITVHLTEVDYYRDSGSHPLYFRDHEESLQVKKAYRESFKKCFAKQSKLSGKIAVFVDTRPS